MANKIDKGFELIYWNLSYRRKFIRTLWMTPLVLLIIILIAFLGKISENISSILIIGFLILALLFQLIYTYKKWKKEERLHDE